MPPNGTRPRSDGGARHRPSRPSCSPAETPGRYGEWVLAEHPRERKFRFGFLRPSNERRGAMTPGCVGARADPRRCGLLRRVGTRGGALGLLSPRKMLAGNHHQCFPIGLALYPHGFSDGVCGPLSMPGSFLFCCHTGCLATHHTEEFASLAEIIRGARGRSRQPARAALRRAAE